MSEPLQLPGGNLEAEVIDGEAAIYTESLLTWLVECVEQLATSGDDKQEYVALVLMSVVEGIAAAHDALVDEDE